MTKLAALLIADMLLGAVLFPHDLVEGASQVFSLLVGTLHLAG